MAYLDKYNILVGETIMQCQRIEHDIKLIYAGMMEGDIDENRDMVADLALGTVLVGLKKLDHSDHEPYFSRDDYKLLREIKNIRNWLVHQAYVDFIYSPRSTAERDLNESFTKLQKFNKDVTELGQQVEDIRLDVLKKYDRI